METDFLKEFHRKYLSRANRFVTLALKNGEQVEGIIAAFALGSEKEGEPYIIHFRVVPQGKETAAVVDSLGNLEGQVICPKEIEEVHFSEDNTVLKFPLHE